MSTVVIAVTEHVDTYVCHLCASSLYAYKLYPSCRHLLAYECANTSAGAWKFQLTKTLHFSKIGNRLSGGKFKQG